MKQTTNIVTQHLIQAIYRQIQERHIAVWFDPEKQYVSLAHAHNCPGVHLYSYDPQQGYLALRRQLEAVWGTIDPPQLLIYIPAAEEQSQHALIEYTTAGATLQPGQQPLECNTRLAIIARQALNGILPATNLAKVITEVEKGQLSLAELDEIASRHKEIHVGALALIFKSGNIEEICLQFLASRQFDEDIQAKNAAATLAALLKNELETQVEESEDLGKIRQSLARHLLLTEFVNDISKPTPKAIPSALRTFKAPQSRAAKETALRLVKEWRLRNDYADSYIKAAQDIEKELDLANHSWSIETLEHTETFAGIDAILQALLEKSFIEKPLAELVDIARRRQDAFWPNQIPTLKLHWQVIVGAGQVLIQANAIRSSLKVELPAALMVKNYTGSAAPWCKLDTTFRRLERDEHSFDFEAAQHDSLQKLLASARLNYAEVVHTMTERFMRAYEKTSFHLPEWVQQNNIYHDFVQPAMEDAKTAYILVDAFRYEMALDLFEQIEADWDCRITPALAVPPTITEVGMAALMPDAEKGLALVPAGAGKLGAVLQKNTLKNRADRAKFIGISCPQSIVLELSQIAPLKDKKVIKSLAGVKLAVITASDEIDGLWENQPEIARRLNDDVFNQLRRGIRNLLNAGFQTILITSDHGFIAGDNLMIGVPMDPPGGETIDLHRRVWVGRGGAAIPSCLRKPVSAFGIGGDLELVTPKGLGCFKAAGGSTQYYHGGLSLQEMMIPVLSIHPGKNYSSTAKEPAFVWVITLGSKQISARVFTATIEGNATDLLAVPPRIRLELKTDNQVLSTPVSATYGLDETTKDVKMKMEEGSTTLTANKVTLFLGEVPAGTTSLDLDLINSETGLALARISNIPVAIAF